MLQLPMYLMYLRDRPVQDAGSLKEYVGGLDGGLGTNCYLLNCVKLTLLFAIVNMQVRRHNQC